MIDKKREGTNIRTTRRAPKHHPQGKADNEHHGTKAEKLPPATKRGVGVGVGIRAAAPVLGVGVMVLVVQEPLLLHLLLHLLVVHGLDGLLVLA